jgi:6,7-dimethyl-8-ribityllumazine synthase
MSDASETPNVIIPDPKVRKGIQIALAVAGVIVGTAVVVDGSTPAFDITAITTPVTAGLLYLGSALGFAVTIPNIPKS